MNCKRRASEHILNNFFIAATYSMYIFGQISMPLDATRYFYLQSADHLMFPFLGLWASQGMTSACWTIIQIIDFWTMTNSHLVILHSRPVLEQYSKIASKAENCLLKMCVAYKATEISIELSLRVSVAFGYRYSHAHFSFQLGEERGSSIHKTNTNKEKALFTSIN